MRRLTRSLLAIAFASLAVATALEARFQAPDAPLAPLLVDPNTVPSMVLETLPRIGPALARRIIEAREVRPFLDLDDLDRRVKGVGPATTRGMRPFLRFEAATDREISRP